MKLTEKYQPRAIEEMVEQHRRAVKRARDDYQELDRLQRRGSIEAVAIF